MRRVERMEARSTNPGVRRRLCPGPRRAWWARVMNPWRWFWRGCCFYDLSGLGGGDGGVICPECGRRIADEREVYRSARRLRVWAVLAAVVTVAVSPFALENVRNGKWVPTTVLIGVVALPEWMEPDAWCGELDRRVESGTVGATNRRLYAEYLVTCLRHNDFRGDADHARWILPQLIPEAEAALEGALDSPDLQERHVACRMLQRHGTSPPTRRMLEVCIEGLRDDIKRRPGYDTAEQLWGHVRGCMEYLHEHGDESVELFWEAVRSENEQQRFLAAAGLCFLRRVDDLEDVVPILVERLGDNHANADAAVAACALVSLGDRVVPSMRVLMESVDVQLADTAKLIVLIFEEGAYDEKGREEREKLNRVFEGWRRWEAIFDGFRTL